jgi:hypothetical protein
MVARALQQGAGSLGGLGLWPAATGIADRIASITGTGLIVGLAAAACRIVARAPFADPGPHGSRPGSNGRPGCSVVALRPGHLCRACLGKGGAKFASTQACRRRSRSLARGATLSCFLLGDLGSEAGPREREIAVIASQLLTRLGAVPRRPAARALSAPYHGSGGSEHGAVGRHS